MQLTTELEEDDFITREINWRKIYILPGSGAFSSRPAFLSNRPTGPYSLEELVITGKAVPLYAGLPLRGSSVTSAIMSPIWGASPTTLVQNP